MTAAALLPRRRRASAAVVALLALLVTLLVPTAARADAGMESAFANAVNAERAAHGLAPLAVAGDLVDVARRHSARMGSADDLHHNPNMTSEVSNWQKAGENVGRGPSVDPIHAAFMASPGHRANILDPSWTEMGVGVVVVDGTVWVTQLFRLPMSAPAPAPAPEPAPAPAAAAEPAPAPEPEPEPVAEAPAPEQPAPVTPAAETVDEAPEPTPDAPAGDRALVMLTRVEAEDAALDAA